MLVSFDSLAPHSRLWIFQSDRKFSNHERQIISDSLTSFINSWLVHGQPMIAAFDIRHDQFVIIGADETVNAASGCSIDKAVRQISELGNTLGIDWFNRNNVAFFINEQVSLLSLRDMKRHLAEGEWSGSTLVFNNTIAVKAELDRWLAPASKTWLQRYLPQEKVVP